MTTHRIKISRMACEACVQSVKSVLAGVEGVMARAVWVGSAVLRCESQQRADAACAALAVAGYPALQEPRFESTGTILAASLQPQMRTRTPVATWVATTISFSRTPGSPFGGLRL